jgi:hypothetical protein
LGPRLLFAKDTRFSAMDIDPPSSNSPRNAFEIIICHVEPPPAVENPYAADGICVSQKAQNFSHYLQTTTKKGAKLSNYSDEVRTNVIRALARGVPTSQVIEMFKVQNVDLKLQTVRDWKKNAVKTLNTTWKKIQEDPGAFNYVSKFRGRPPGASDQEKARDEKNDLSSFQRSYNH